MFLCFQTWSVCGKQKPKRVKAMYNCVADNPDELTFSEGEVIVVDGEEDQEWWVSIRLQLCRWHTLYSNSGMRERTTEEKWVYHISLPITGWLLISKLHWGPRSGSVSLAGKQAAGLYSVSRLRSHWLCLVNHSPWRLINGKAKSPNLCVPVWLQGYLHKNVLQWVQAAFPPHFLLLLFL